MKLFPTNPRASLDHRRLLRKNSTDAERRLWRYLRNRGLTGAKFYRQCGFGPFVLDFFCFSRRIAIELDGGQHNDPERRLRDLARTAYLEGFGIRVLRFWNRDVLENADGTLERIMEALKNSHDSSLNSPGPS